MKKLLFAIALLLAPSTAFAQCTGIFAPNTFCGNNTGSPAAPFPVPASSTLVGPGTTVVNDLATWGNTSGTLLLDHAPAALSAVNDTNITAVLSGSPTSALVNAATITFGWSGTLAAGRLNANVVQGVTNDTNVTGSIATQNLTLGWTGTLAAGRLNANVVQAFTNDTNVTASITAQNATLGWTGTLALARGGTGASTQAGAATAIFPTPVTTGDVVYWNGGAWTTLTGNSSGTQVLSENASGVPSWITVTGTGTVTAITPGAGLVSSGATTCSQSAITSSGTLSTAKCVNAQVGTTYAIQDSDRGKLITATNSASQAYTIAQAGASTTFQAGWFTDILNSSPSGVAGAGVVTITATTSTFSSSGATTLKVYPGQSVRITSDGTNYQVTNITPGGGTKVLLATLTASSSTTLSDTTSFLAPFTDFDVVFENIIPSNNNVVLQFTIHSGGTFQSTNYLATTSFTNTAAGIANTTTNIQLSQNTQQNSSNGPGFSGYITAYHPGAGISVFRSFSGVGGYQNSTNFVTAVYGGTWTGGTGVIDGFQIAMSAGTIASGIIKVYGRVN